MVWLFLAWNLPDRRLLHCGGDWVPTEPPGLVARGSTVTGVWWHAFRTREAAESARQEFRRANARSKFALRTRVREMARVPRGWQ